MALGGGVVLTKAFGDAFFGDEAVAATTTTATGARTPDAGDAGGLAVTGVPARDDAGDNVAAATARAS